MDQDGGPYLLLIGLTFASTSQAAQIVVPNANATVKGDSRLNSAPFNDPSRYQQIFAASQFGSAPLLITQIAFRPDVTQATPFSNAFSELRIDLSTTSVAVNSLSSTFANNVGANNTTVFDQAVTLSSANLPGPGNTKQFDVIIALTTPFLYNPAAGNLLMDMRNFDPDFTGFVDGQVDLSGTITALVFADNDPNGTTGQVQPAGGVVQFTTRSVPDSGSSLSMLVIATMALIAAKGLASNKARQLLLIRGAAPRQ